MTTERAGLREAAQNLSDRRTLMDDGFWVSQKEMRALDIALATPDEPVAGLDVETGARLLQAAVGAVPWFSLMEHERDLRRNQVRAFLAGDPDWKMRIDAAREEKP